MRAHRCIAAILGLFVCSVARADGLLYVANYNAGTVAEYTTTGATINASAITGLANPTGITVIGSHLFVADGGTNTVGEYNLDGTVVNAKLITGLNYPLGLAAIGDQLFVADSDNGRVVEYNTSSGILNSSFITAPNGYESYAVVVDNGTLLANFDTNIGSITNRYDVSGNIIQTGVVSTKTTTAGFAAYGSNLFFTNEGNVVSQFTNTGTLVNPSLISGLSSSYDLATSGPTLFISDYNTGKVGAYDLLGHPINAALVTAYPGLSGIAVLLSGDTNNDGVVNSQDLALISSNWLGTAVGDLNGDGIVNSQDLAQGSANWLQVALPTTTQSVPEPGTLPLGTFAAMISFLRARRAQANSENAPKDFAD